MNKKAKNTIRKKRVTSKVKRVTNKPILHVYRSNKHIYAQVIDQKTGKILAAASDAKLKGDKLTKGQKAAEVGALVAKQAIKSKVKEVAFNRGSHKYHGRVKQLADSARKEGLQF